MPLLRRCLRFLVPCLACAISPAGHAAGSAGPANDAGSYNVRAFGATGDGKTLDTDAINRAIEAAAAAGGGTVVFPAGSYLSFSIRLKSHLTLRLEAGCRIIAAKASPGFGGYDAAEPNVPGDQFQYQDFGHSHFHNSLIWGEDLEDVAITGPGLIFGQGLSRANGFRPGRNGASAAGPNNTPTPGDTAGQAPRAAPAGVPLPTPDRGGNKSIALKNCRNVTLSGFSILQGGWFGLLASGVDNFTIANVKVDTNRDGFDIDCCRNVRISDCTVNAINDDAIVLKSTYVFGVLRPTENVTITGCEVTGYDPGSCFDGTYRHAQALAVDRDGPTGRIKIGTESGGDFKNITISNAVFDRSRGLAIESVDGAHVEDIAISNITMRDVSNAPIFIRLGSRMREQAPEGTTIGSVRRVSISNVVVYDADPRYPSIISGIPGHDVEDIKLSDIRILCRGGLTLDHAAKQPAEMASTFFAAPRRGGPVPPRDAFDVPEREVEYPEPSMFGVLPAYGFFIRHAKGIELNNVDVGFTQEDRRPAFVLDDVTNADFQHVKAQKASGIPTIVFRKVEDFTARACTPLPDTKIPQVDRREI